jgi:NAD(P)-dependent dehydrogenase (short-subunit alcohol dehydrogenase family)
MNQSTLEMFDLSNKTALITGGGGLLGPKHAEAILECNGSVILADINLDAASAICDSLNKKYNNRCKSIYMDVTNAESISKALIDSLPVDILVNNAAKDPKVKKGDSSLKLETRFETMSFDYWRQGTEAIVDGTFLCTQAVVNQMINRKATGVILNIASDLSVIAPDQRIYQKPDTEWSQQPVKPITYSAAKWAVIGMTKYLAVYLAQQGIRVNCLSPTGVFNDHPEDFVTKLSNIIPMGRMANIDEYKGAVAFLCSNASTYMTGHNLIIDGGKTVW